jgi:hypothetical protein
MATTIRTLTDTVRGELGYGGSPVPISCGICIDDLKKDLHCPSGTALAYYRKAFGHEQDFIDFVRSIIGKPTGTALDGRLSWST